MAMIRASTASHEVGDRSATPAVVGCGASVHALAWSAASSLAADLLREERVAVVPGEAFGLDGHFRMSFATSRERIEEGIKRVGRFFLSRA